MQQVQSKRCSPAAVVYFDNHRPCGLCLSKFPSDLYAAIATSNCVPWIYWMCVPIYRWIRGWQRMWTCGLPWVMGSSIGKSQIDLHTIVNQRIQSQPNEIIRAGVLHIYTFILCSCNSTVGVPKSWQCTATEFMFMYLYAAVFTLYGRQWKASHSCTDG